MNAPEPHPAPADADAYFHMFHRSLGIHLTMRCPLECAHCSVHSGPSRTDSIEGELLLERLEDMGQAGYVKRLSLSGGEPFLMRSLLKGILEIADRHGIVTVINTAAHWAGTPERALNAVKDFPSVTELGISADEYHKVFVPLENVRNAARASLDKGLVTSLVIRAWRGADDPFTTELRQAMGEELWRSVKLDIDVIKHVGRAESLPRRERQPPVRPQDIPEGYCHYADQPVLDCDGRIFACCNTAGARMAPFLQLGHLAQHSLPRITEAAGRNKVLQAIRVWGPARLRDMLAEAGLAHRLESHYADASICKLCTDICSKPDLIAYLQRVLDQPDVYPELAMSRLLRYGESFPDLGEKLAHEEAG